MLVSRMRENLTSGSLGGRWKRGLVEMGADLSTGGKPPRNMRGHPSSARLPRQRPTRLMKVAIVILNE